MSTFNVITSSQKKTVGDFKQVLVLTLEGEAVKSADKATEAMKETGRVTCEWFTDKNTKVEPGSTIDGDISSGEYGWKFEKAGGGKRGGGGFRGKSPEELAQDKANSSLIRAYEYYLIPPDNRPPIREYIETAGKFHTAVTRLAGGKVALDA